MILNIPRRTLCALPPYSTHGPGAGVLSRTNGLAAERMNMTGRVYISGPMTGLPEYNAGAFRAAAASLRAMGFEVVNPSEIEPLAGRRTWEHFMRADIKALCDCDIIVLLPGWQNSKGARLEAYVAKSIGLSTECFDSLVDDPETIRLVTP